jgi:hypothetical protein
LRGPGQCLFPVSEFREDPGFQERFHQRADAFVLDPRPQAIHQSRMRNLVETGFDVALQHPLVIPGAGGEIVDLGDCVLRPPVRAEPIGARLEIRLEDGLEHQFKACLDHAISDGRNTEATKFPIRLRYHHPPHFDRPELASFQRLPDLAQESHDPDRGLDHSHGGLVDPCGPGALTGGHAFPRGHQERRIVNEVEQVTEPAGRIFSRPAVQLGLHPPYHDAGRVIIRPGHGAGIHRRIFGHYNSFLD